MTYENSQQTFLDETVFPLMSSAEASRARTSAQWGSEPDSPLILDQDYGQKSPVWLARLDQNTWSWRTSQICLVALASSQGDGLAEFSETWPRSGMMRNGTVYQLQPLAPLTKGTESGFWPTPRKNDPMKRGKIANDPRNGLAAAARYWPTPRAAKRGPRNPDTALALMAANGRSSFHRLEDATACAEMQIGIPNPTFVEWLMGFPTTWTETERSATPSCPRSPSLSDEQS